MPTTNQQKDFSQYVTGSLLDDTIQWISDNMEPEDVFTEKQLESWATAHEVDSIFPKSDLEAWAEANGYVKE